MSFSTQKKLEDSLRLSTRVTQKVGPQEPNTACNLCEQVFNRDFECDDISNDKENRYVLIFCEIIRWYTLIYIMSMFLDLKTKGLKIEAI